MGRVSTCQTNCNTIDLRRAQVNNELDGVSNQQPRDYLLNRLFRQRSKKASRLRVTGPCEENLPVTGEFPAQMASNAEKVSIWWRHHEHGLSHGVLLSFQVPLGLFHWHWNSRLRWWKWSIYEEYHDDVIKWKHFPRYWPFVRGIHRSPVNSPHKGQWHGDLMFSLICARINAWLNNVRLVIWDAIGLSMTSW